MLNAADKTHYDLHGALVYDPCIGQFQQVQEQIPIVPFVKSNAQFFNFDASTMSSLESQHESCGYASYIDSYLQFPPSGKQPYLPAAPPSGCDLFNSVYDSALNGNSCFNIYEVNQTCPTPFDQVQPNNGAQAYFDRADVRKALHAPTGPTWNECGSNPFSGRGGPEGEGDLSPDPIQGVLPQVVEATNRVLVANGDYDMIILTNGTLMSIQNMTWNGALGFQNAPVTPIMVPEQGGQMGVQHFERGLMWGQTYMSGHMQPQYQKIVAYRHLNWLLGYSETL
jgi:carboxypeptidase D